MNLQLFEDFNLTAKENMQKDESLLQFYETEKTPLLRLYSWNAPCFTYGRNQNPEEIFNLEQINSDGIEIAKRPSGGDTLYHGDEIAYCFVSSFEDIGCSYSVKESYSKILNCLKKFYLDIGVSVDLKNDSDEKSHICMAAAGESDITLKGKKIGGHAQRRMKNVFMQHGTIPFSVDWDFVRKYVKNVPADIEDRYTSLSEHILIDKEQICDKLIESFKNLDAGAFGTHDL